MSSHCNPEATATAFKSKPRASGFCSTLGSAASKPKPDSLPTRTGKPIYKRYSKQPSSEIDKWWLRHIGKVQEKHSDLASLPFGSLRDVLPNILTRDYGENVATLALQHKTFPEDKLLKCYANLPFKQLFKATRELHATFKPMLEILAGV